ncbi:MAG: hypothetical protein LBV73_27340 [Paraburkholderia sp.]|jgi:hypothetical protein|nr:hypothetical protein [Paraburkholderia sp.]
MSTQLNGQAPHISGILAMTGATSRDMEPGARFRTPMGRVAVFCQARQRIDGRSRPFLFRYEDAASIGDELLLTFRNLRILQPLRAQQGEHASQ